MYRMKLWDEDKWNIHSGSYSSSKYSSLTSEDKKEDKKYHEQKYDAKEKNPSSDYLRKQEGKDNEDKENPSHFDELVEDEKKEQKIDDDELTFKAAKQVFDEKRHEPQKAKVKKDVKTIEDAIKKAVEEEKQVIIMD
mgnify:CR=1 FL=1